MMLPFEIVLVAPKSLDEQSSEVHLVKWQPNSKTHLTTTMLR